MTTKRLTLKSLNKHFQDDLGLDVEIVKGEGYYYFVGSAVSGAYSTSVFVFTLNSLDRDRWVSELQNIIKGDNPHDH